MRGSHIDILYNQSKRLTAPNIKSGKKRPVIYARIILAGLLFCTVFYLPNLHESIEIHKLSRRFAVTIKLGCRKIGKKSLSVLRFSFYPLWEVPPLCSKEVLSPLVKLAEPSTF